MTEESTTTVLETAEPETTTETSQETIEVDYSGWKSSLHEDYRNSASIETLESLDDLAKAFIDTKAMVGANTIKMPGKNASEEEMNAFFDKLGRPESADKYGIPEENMPEGFQINPDRLKAYTEEAHRLGLNDQQFAGMVRADAKYMAELQSKATTQQEEYFSNQEAELRKEFGQAFDEKVAMANAALQQFGGESLPDVISKAGLGLNSEFIGFLVKVGEKLADDEVVGSGGNRSFMMSPADAKAAIDAKHIDSDFMKAYQDNQNPGNSAARAEMRKLYEIAYPDENP